MRWLPTVAAIALTGLLAGCVPPPPGSPGPQDGPTPEEKLRQRIQALEQELAQLKEADDGTEGLREALESLTVEMDKLRRELRGQRGDLEVVQHRLDRVADRQERLYEDVDARLRALEQDSGPGGGAGSEDRDKSGDGGAQKGEDRTADEAYKAAFAKIEANEYEAATQAFEQFLAEHGDSDLAPNARYWLGEAHYVSRRFEQALQAFKRVLEEYPESRKAAASLLKIGYSFYELGDYDSARQSLERLRERFSDSSEAQLAKKRLERMAEEGH